MSTWRKKHVFRACLLLYLLLENFKCNLFIRYIDADKCPYTVVIAAVLNECVVVRGLDAIFRCIACMLEKR